MESTQKVSPALSETIKWHAKQTAKNKRRKSVNLFEMLEDRYAYEGFNRFIFFLFWLLNELCDTIWVLYSRTDESRKKKAESRTEGNHVRKVIKPMEDRIRKIEKKVDEMGKKMDSLLDAIRHSQRST